MSGLRLRTACLALAAWAVLFAPGRAAVSEHDPSPVSSSDRLAAAVIAPTFGTQALAGREGDSEVAGAVEADVPDGVPEPSGSTSAVSALVLVSLVGHDRRPGQPSTGVPTGRRAPPTGVPPPR